MKIFNIYMDLNMEHYFGYHAYKNINSYGMEKCRQVDMYFVYTEHENSQRTQY